MLVSKKFAGHLARLTVGHLSKHILLIVPLLATMAVQGQAAPTVTLPGHVLGILPNATPLPRTKEMDQEPLTVCLILNVSDQASLDAFKKDFHDPSSPNYRHTISVADVAARFGPTQLAYDTVLGYLQQNGFTLLTGSANRRTITVRGTRAQAESAFHTGIDDYVLEGRNFHANASDPALPADIAPLVAGITGLSNLARWHPASAPSPAIPGSILTAYKGALTAAGSTNTDGLPPGLDGSGQTLGLIEFSNYAKSDVTNFLSAAGLDASLIDHLTQVNINGGTPLTGSEEVLLDIDAALGALPQAKIVAYVAPFEGSAADFYTAINTAIGDIGTGGTISMSWYECETEILSSDAVTMDVLLDIASLSGITMFSATGDAGSTCFATSGAPKLYPNTIAYPADAPHAVAVGGTTLDVDSDNSYKSESWWSGGGYGITAFPLTMIYSSGVTRSVPDVAFNANPSTGITVCQATPTLSPNCHTAGGTSMATPLFASVWVLVNEARSDASEFPLSAADGFLYGIPGAFHAPGSMTGAGNDPQHLGLGSPDIPTLVAKAGPNLTVSSISPNTGAGAGGTTVTITGAGFIGVQKVMFAGVAATNVKIYSDSKLTAESPVAPAATADIQVVTPLGTSATSSKDVFSYLPDVTSISPNNGPVDGGTVTVNGHALAGYSIAFFKFDFGGTLATSVFCATTTSCTMVAPAHSAGTVDVIVETGWGDSPAVSGDRFTYVAPAIASVSPNSGPLIGTSVTVSGQGLSDKFKFDFGGSLATSVSCASTTSCTMNAPSRSAGTVDVIIETGSSNSSPTSGDRFTYQAPAITGISPSIGPTTGSQQVTITGSGFDNTMTVHFGGATISGASCGGTITSCTVYSPAGAGSVHITVTLAGVTSPQTSADVYTYAVFPSITDITPNTDPTNVAVAVTITGTNFSTATGGTVIQIGTLETIAATCSSSTKCTVNAPARDSDAPYLGALVTATVNGHTSIQNIYLNYGVIPPVRKPPIPPCKGTACF